MIGKRQSRLSTDGCRKQPRAPSPSSYAEDRCPSCGQRRLTTVVVDDDLLVSICDGCGRGYGVDDSMDSETLARLLVDEELCKDVQITAVTCDQCHNTDADLFEIVCVDPPVICVQCKDCLTISEISLKVCASDGSGNVDDTWMMKDLNDRNRNDVGATWTDSSDRYIMDSQDYRDVGDCNAGREDPIFSCRCGNNEAACFHLQFHPVTGDLSRVTCLICDREKVMEEEFCGVECAHCDNNRTERFTWSIDDYGRITFLRCLECNKRLHLPGQTTPTKRRTKNARVDKMPPAVRKSGHTERQSSKVESGVGTGWTKIEDLRHVRRGDHIAWHKWYAIWHHAIVVDVPAGGRELTVIHYTGGVVKVDGHLASIREETLEVNPSKEDVYRIDYQPGDSYPADKVVWRARDRLREAKYNPFTNNCEHFARWCKSGRAECGQVSKFAERCRLACQSAVHKATQEMAGEAVESIVGSAGKVAAVGIRGRAGQVFGTASGAVRNVKCGALACSVAVNLAVEAALFTKDTVVAYRRYKSGAISRDEFRRQLAKLGCECVGGLIGGTGLGIVGQILIPVPFLGGLIGCTLGNLIGRYTGAVIGKQLAAIKR